MNERSRKADSSASGAWIALSAVLFAALVGQAGAALAADSFDSPETIAEADWIGIRQVLVIPQQCSRKAVSTLCDRGESAGKDFAARRAARDGAVGAFATGDSLGSGYGSVADYERQRTAGGPVPVAPGYVTIPPAIPVAPARASGPGSRTRTPAHLATPPHP